MRFKRRQSREAASAPAIDTDEAGREMTRRAFAAAGTPGCAALLAELERGWARQDGGGRQAEARQVSAPDQPPGFALAIRWRGRADIYPVGEDVRFVAVMRLPGCPPPYVLVARTEDQLERQLTAQTGGK